MLFFLLTKSQPYVRFSRSTHDLSMNIYHLWSVYVSCFRMAMSINVMSACLSHEKYALSNLIIILEK